MFGPLPEISLALFVLEMVGTLAFAIAGALRALDREMDIFGVLVLALVTALGGGIIRDILADRFPLSLDRPIYVYTALLGGLVAVPFAGIITKYGYWLNFFDALGLGIFSILGAQVGLAKDLNVVSVMLLGLLTGIGGGVLRDVLANDVPLVLRQEIYALASLTGIAIMLGLRQLGVSPAIAGVSSAVLIFLIRLAAIRWNLNLPRLPRL